jgi:hypothetical protein
MRWVAAETSDRSRSIPARPLERHDGPDIAAAVATSHVLVNAEDTTDARDGDVEHARRRAGMVDQAPQAYATLERQRGDEDHELRIGGGPSIRT